MRKHYQAFVPVELAPGVPATLVIRHATAVKILHDEAHFQRDPREWQATIPADSPILAMLGYLPAARFNTGAMHDRYRSASAFSIDGVNLNGLMSTIEEIGTDLINTFCQTGQADLMMDYAFPLVLELLNRICGCPDDIGREVAEGMRKRFDQSSKAEAAQGMQQLKSALMELITLKRDQPGDDATTRLVQHSTNLDDDEVWAQLMSFYGAGFELQRNLIVNTLLMMLTDSRYHDGAGRNLSTGPAIDEVLFNDPPMANFCATYPKHPVPVDGSWLPPDQPVIISLAACNNDPEIRDRHLEVPGGPHSGNRSHLAWSVGAHACPAKPLAYNGTQIAIDWVLNALPDMQVAVPYQQLVWRPGPFSRGLITLPVVFDPVPPM
ncbi:cytochrome P450 [Nocardia carnea]|uniref:cytochrome P450 n=1 Tax=Nocardia carnea TaxID=37328 RepID=UPI002458E9EE|nr:cytochrome P450 [Nocardia carnea]